MGKLPNLRLVMLLTLNQLTNPLREPTLAEFGETFQNFRLKTANALDLSQLICLATLPRGAKERNGNRVLIVTYSPNFPALFSLNRLPSRI